MYRVQKVTTFHTDYMRMWYVDVHMCTNSYVLWLFMDDGSVEACGLWVQRQHQLRNKSQLKDRMEKTLLGAILQ